jgi:GT2 family glycosyltransferase
MSGQPPIPAPDAPLPACVLICSRNRPELLMETVQSVLAGRTVPRELLVVDQSDVAHPQLPGLGTVRGCSVRYVHSRTQGLSRARNIGLRAARAAIVVLLDDDMLVEPDWLEQLLAGSGSPAWGPRTVVTGRVLAAAPQRGASQLSPAAVFAHAEPATYRGRQRSDVVPGANVALPRELALGLGGFDERLGAGGRFSSADDNDMGFRLLEAGCEVRHVPAAIVFHRAWRSRSDLARLRWSYGRGKGAFYAKHARLRDRHTLARMGADVRLRLGRAVCSLARSPTGAAGQLLYLAGMLSGALEWWLRTAAQRTRRPSSARQG